MSTILQPTISVKSPARHLAALGMAPMHAASLMLVSLALVAWSRIATQHSNAGLLMFALAYPLAAYYTGRLVLAPVRIDAALHRSFALRFLSGYLVLGVIQLAVRAVAPGYLSVQFALILAAVAVGQMLVEANGEEEPESTADALTGLFVTAFSLLAATFWARGLFHAVQPNGDQIIFHHWIDLFTHANQVGRFTAKESFLALGHFEMCGLPTQLYHYASYLAPATASAFSQQSAYETVTWCWTPPATFLTGLAAYVLVKPWAGRTGGLCAVVALLALPDPSYFEAGNGYLGYHWLQQIGAGGAYGTACGALALSFLLQWHRLRSRSALVAGLCFAAVEFWYKAQVFVVFMPLVVACLILWQPGVTVRTRWLRFAAVLGIGLTALLVARLHPAVDAVLFQRDAFVRWHNLVMGPSARDPGTRAFFMTPPGVGRLATLWYYARMVGGCAVCSFGVWLALGLLLQLARLPRPRVEDLLPWGAIAIYLGVYASLDDTNLVGHNWGELTHRPVVWVYFLLCTWCAGRCGQMLAAASEARWAPIAVAVMAVLLLALPYRMGRSVQEGRCAWAHDCVNRPQPRGLVECGKYIAANGSREDVMEHAGYDPALVGASFAERRAYLSRPKDWLSDKTPAVRAEAERRHVQVEALKQCDDLEDLRRSTAVTGIRWFVLGPGDVVRWPDAVQQTPAFAAHGYRVYDLFNLP